MHRNCPLKNESARPAYNVQEAETVGQVARVVPSIYSSLEDRFNVGNVEDPTCVEIVHSRMRV